MKHLFGFIALLSFQVSFCQSDSSKVIEEDTTEYISFFKVDKLDEVEDIILEEKENTAEFKKKKPKKRVFYGKKTKRGFIKTTKGTDIIIEHFHYLKVWEEPSKYVKDIFWYSFENNKIEKSKKFDSQSSKILHGPYKKTINNVTLVEGIYYVGTKHGRWIEYTKPKEHKFRTGDDKRKYYDDENNVVILDGSDTIITYQELISKESFNRGWPKNAEISYYDPQKEKLKEVIPYDADGNMTGEYYLYYKNGKIQLRGNLFDGKRVGYWTEYQTIKGKVRKLKELKYPDYPESEEPEGELIRLFDETGIMIYDKSSGLDKRPKKE